MNQRIIIESLAMDLKRVALGAHRGSQSVALRFLEEALIRKSEINSKNLPLYLKKILVKLAIPGDINKRFAEDVLMYSILFQNYIIKNYK